MVAHIRSVKTASGATAIQIVHSARRGSRKIEHIGSAHTPEEVGALKAVAKQRLEEGRARLDLGLEVAAAAESGLNVRGPHNGPRVFDVKVVPGLGSRYSVKRGRGSLFESSRRVRAESREVV